MVYEKRKICLIFAHIIHIHYQHQFSSNEYLVVVLAYTAISCSTGICVFDNLGKMVKGWLYFHGLDGTHFIDESANVCVHAFSINWKWNIKFKRKLNHCIFGKGGNNDATLFTNLNCVAAIYNHFFPICLGCLREMSQCCSLAKHMGFGIKGNCKVSPCWTFVPYNIAFDPLFFISKIGYSKNAWCSLCWIEYKYGNMHNIHNLWYI